MTATRSIRISPRAEERRRIDSSQVRITLRGDLPDTVLIWAIQTLHRAVAADQHLTCAHIAVAHRQDPARPYRADLTAHVDGRLLHARADAENAADALALAGDRLREQVTARNPAPGAPDTSARRVMR